MDNIDHWVGEALWNQDPDYYDQLRGYTKRPRIGRTLHSLLGFAGPPIYKKQVFSDGIDEIYQSVLDEVSAMFRKVEVLDYKQSAYKLPMNGAAGYSFPGKTKGDVIDKIIKSGKINFQLLKQGRRLSQIPYKLGQRGHLSPVDEVKSRPIWMGAAETALLENSLFRGFYDQIFNKKHFQDLILTGKDSMKRLHEFLELRPDDTFVNTDISGWDYLPCRFLMKDIFSRIFRPNINLDEDWKVRLFDHVEFDFIYSLLALPNGTIVRKSSGVPSGSVITLLFNSLANLVIQKTILRYLDVNFYHEKVLGDDFAFCLDHRTEDEFDEFISRYSRACLRFFGLTVKPEKVIITNNLDDRKFIGYQTKGGRIYREDGELMKGILYPEHEVRDLQTSFSRVFAFYLIGGCTSDKFNGFYEIYLSGYYDKLHELGNNLFNLEILKHGKLRVFKHLYHIDIDYFKDFSIEDFRNIYASKAPFFLTLGAQFMY